MSHPFVTLTTDFGTSSPYVAQLKAAALSVCPELGIIDLTHAIAPQNVREGALVLADVTPLFPANTLHVCVVDPGVGTHRKIVYAEIGPQRYVAPDNGLLSLLACHHPLHRIVTLEQPRFWGQRVTATFHGRDIMAPVAAHLANGLDPQKLGGDQAAIKLLKWPEVQCNAQSITGEVLLVDHFGNLITNILRPMLPQDVAGEAIRVACGPQQGLRLVKTYAQVAAGTLVALVGSSDRLEVAESGGHAAARLAVGVGQPVKVTWPGGHPRGPKAAGPPAT